MLHKETNVKFNLNREKILLVFFNNYGDSVYCRDVAFLSSILMKSLKCVLLHNVNLFRATHIGHSVYLKEIHEHIKDVLN